MVVNLSKDREAQLIAEHHTRSSLIQADQQAAVQRYRAEKERINNHWAKVKADLPTRVSSKDKECATCNDIIQAYTPHKVATAPKNIHGNWGMRTNHYCARCRPLTGASQ